MSFSPTGTGSFFIFMIKRVWFEGARRVHRTSSCGAVLYLFRLRTSVGCAAHINYFEQSRCRSLASECARRAAPGPVVTPAYLAGVGV